MVIECTRDAHSVPAKMASGFSSCEFYGMPDGVGSEMLGHVAGRIEYLQLANGLIGSMEGIEVVTG